MIVGIDDFDFIDQADSFDVPSFVADKKLPHFWDFYFSARVAAWSAETLLDISPLERYYDADLTGQVRTERTKLSGAPSDPCPRATLAF